MNKKDRRIVNEAIDNLAEGKVGIPIPTRGNEHLMLEKLERLRIYMRDYRDDVERSREHFESDMAGVAHDLKTPLAVISGYAECMSAGMDDKDYPTLIMEKASQMNERILSIVEANRKKSSDKPIFEKIHAKDFFAEEFSKLAPTVRAKGITYKVGKTPDVLVYGERIALSRIVQNLVSNAVKYTPAGGKIKVSFTRQSTNLVFKVEDNGIGISKDDLPRIFDKYYRADKSRSDGQSNGLGLSVANDLVEAHGGTIKVTSKLGKGTTFTVKIPLEPEYMRGTAKIDASPRAVKLVLFIVPFWIMTFVYRFMKYAETGKVTNLVAFLLLSPFFIFIWIFDIVDIALNNKISFLVE